MLCASTATTSLSNNRPSVIHCKSINSVTATDIPVQLELMYMLDLCERCVCTEACFSFVIICVQVVAIHMKYCAFCWNGTQ